MVNSDSSLGVITMPAAKIPAALTPSQFHCSLEEVASELGVTRERARQIQSEALRKCWFYCWWNGYRADDLLPSAKFRDELDLN